MPVPSTRAGRLDKWYLLRDKLKPRLDELPHLQVDHAGFEQELVQLVRLDQQQETITAELRETTRLRDESETRASKHRNRLVAGLQHHFGHESEKLIEFGINPRKRRSRRKKSDNAPEAAAKAAKSAA